MATRKKTLTLLLCGIAVAYLAIVAGIFLHRHLHVPSGRLAKVPTGTFVVINDTSYQIPKALSSKTVTLEQVPQGAYQIVGEEGTLLPLIEGADGLYFSENFRPVGAAILPGSARNWNEGRITMRDGNLLVEGCMLEVGLMLFVAPFKDVIEWRLELKPSTEPSD
jgi:hypothetical protein